jgi:hypothetical protein
MKTKSSEEKIVCSRSRKIRQAIALIKHLDDCYDMPSSCARVLIELLDYISCNTDNNNKISLSRESVDSLNHF